MLCGDKMNLNFIDNWKDNEIVFQKQLELNKFQLSNSLNYPDHWIADLKLLQLIKFNKCLELGCGVGAFSQFLKYNFSEVDYLGYDYSEVAINFAKTTWESPDKFILKNLHDVTCEDTSGFDLIYISGVVDIIPQEDFIDKLMKLNAPYLLLSRVYLTDQPSYYTTYKAYNEIITYRYHINESIFKKALEVNNYTIYENISEEYLLKKDNA